VVTRIQFYPIILTLIYIFPLGHRLGELLHHDHPWLDQLAYSSLKLQVWLFDDDITVIRDVLPQYEL
jgi:hypothetical protein